MDNSFTFGDALVLLKQGKKAQRKGWNGKGMFILQFSKSDFCIRNTEEDYTDFILDDDSENPIHDIGFEDERCNFYQIEDFILLKTANGTCIPWNASQADMLAEDWMEV